MLMLNYIGNAIFHHFNTIKIKNNITLQYRKAYINLISKTCEQFTQRILIL